MRDAVGMNRHHGSNLLTIEQAADLGKQARENELVLGTTNGVFELLHVGHVYFLAECYKHCDWLLVLVNSDRSAMGLGKGEGRPVTTEKERSMVVGSLKMVDWVAIFDDDDPSRVLGEIQPRVHFKDDEYRHLPMPEAEVVRRAGGQVRYVPRMPCSTTGLLDAIRQATAG